MRRDNIRITGLKEEENEDEETLLAKTVEVAADIRVIVESRDILTVHRLGRSRNAKRPVMVRFCQRKKRNGMMSKKQ